MHRTGSVILVMLAAIFITALPAHHAFADGGGGESGGSSDEDFFADPNYVKAAKMIEQGKFEGAIPLLNRAISKDGKNADAHNLLGFSTRKLGRVEEALEHYLTALRIKPKHRGAHEYIGEAYLALGQLDKAKKHLAFLDDDCWLGCEEYDDLKEAIAQYAAKQAG